MLLKTTKNQEDLRDIAVTLSQRRDLDPLHLQVHHHPRNRSPDVKALQKYIILRLSHSRRQAQTFILLMTMILKSFRQLNWKEPDALNHLFMYLAGEFLQMWREILVSALLIVATQLILILLVLWHPGAKMETEPTLTAVSGGSV